MEDDQIKALSIGLEKSGAKFIWVLRDPDKGDVFYENGIINPLLPLGFEERMERTGLGIMVREWVPQLDILRRSSTGRFMSLYNWNSALESLSLGVPLVVWPTNSDQPTNAFFVTRIIKVGLEMREWTKRNELVSSWVIREVVKRFVGLGEGDGIRKRAQELGCELRKCIECGVSRLELDSFLAHLTRT